MLPLGILKASTRNVLIPKNSTTEIVKIFAQSQRNPRLARPRLTCCNASIRRSGVIERCNDDCIGSGDPSMATCTINPSPRGAASTSRSTRPPPSIGRAQVVVDLRPLQRAREVAVADLRLRVELVDLPATLAVPVSGLLYPTERKMGLCADRRGVDVGDSVVQLVECAKGQVHVARIERRREPVTDTVVDAERFLRVRDADHAQHRAEDLLLFDPHPLLHPREDGRLEEESVLEPLRLGAPASAHEVGAIGLPDVDVALDLRARALVDQRADVRSLLAPIAERHGPRTID